MPRGFSLDLLRADDDDDDDVYLPKGVGKQNDIVILIMGPPGAGKSTFINNVLGKSVAEVSDGFQSCTRRLAHYFTHVPNNSSLAKAFQIGGQNIVLVDTPAFNGAEVEDSEVLRRIAVWLASSYKSGMKVGGVIYLYPVYPNRAIRQDRLYAKVLREICGDQALSKVFLATTRWDICPPESGEKRQREVSDAFWSDMHSGSAPHTGAEVTALWNSKESAWDLIRLVLKQRADSGIDGVVLKIQKQLVDKKKKIKNTAAARELRRRLEEHLRLSSSASTPARKNKLGSQSAEIGRLRLPLGTRILRFSGIS